MLLGRSYHNTLLVCLDSSERSGCIEKASEGDGEVKMGTYRMRLTIFRNLSL